MAYRCKWLVLSKLLLALVCSIPGYTQSVDNYETVTYGQNPIYQADVYFNVMALKNRSFQDVSNANQPEINYYDTRIFPENGENQIRIDFMQVEFAEDVHARKYTLRIKPMNSDDAFLVAGYSNEIILKDKNRHNDNTTATMLFDMAGHGNKTIQLSCDILDENNQVIGNGRINKAFTLIPPPTTQPVAQPQPAQSGQVTEDEFWSSIVHSSKVEDFEFYNLKYPSGKYREKANDKILTIREEKAWIRADQVHMVQEYRLFISRYPNSKYKPEAQKRIASLSPKQPVETANEVDEEEAYWKTVTGIDQSGAYKDYLLRFPNGKYTAQALQNIPLEILAKRSPFDELTFLVDVRYASQTLGISNIEIPSENLSYQPVEPVIPADITTPYDYVQWPEGEVTIHITAQDAASGYTSMQVQLGKRQKYDFQFIDGTEVQNVSLEADIPPLKISGIENLNTSQDTLLFDLQGGVPSYFLRLVKEGNDVTQDEMEQELTRDPVTGQYYIMRSGLADAGLLNGSYMMYILDSRKTDYISWDEEPLIIDKGTWDIKIWQIMLPVLLIIIVFIFFLNKRSQKTNGYGGA